MDGSRTVSFDVWRDDLAQWLRPFVAMLGDRRRAQMCPTYVEGLIGPGDRKSVQPMAMRSPGIGYGADPDMHALPRKTRLDLGQRDITILIEHRNDQIGMGAGLRGTLIANGLASNGAAMFA